MPPRRDFFRIYAVIALANLAMVLANVLHNAGFHWPIAILDRQLDLADEENFAVWFSSAQLLLTALAAGLDGGLL